MDNKVISFPKIKSGPAEPEREEGQDTNVIPFLKNYIPGGFLLVAKLIPPADRIKRCPYCTELAMYRFSWYYGTAKVSEQLEPISCPDRSCIARARNLARSELLIDSFFPVPLY
jgi:hypothetical protein